MSEIIRNLPNILVGWIKPNLQSFQSSREPKVWLISVFVGIAVAFAAVLFRELIIFTYSLWLGDIRENVASAARNIHWIWIIITPTFGGLIVGLILEKFLPARRTGGVADVIEVHAHGGRDIELRPGLISAVTSALSLGFGASSGREGPMVHLGATLATTVCNKMRLPDWGRRTLLGCGVASAISASFNAPIAGVLFAHEVILGHYSKRSFVPIVISSVIGTIFSRTVFGDAAAFSIPDYQITSFLEFPAFVLLGLTCAIVAVVFQFCLIGTDYLARSITMPLWLRPTLGGLMVGTIAVGFPEVLSVGYEATDKALKNEFSLLLLMALIVAKTAATSITLASRFGGGIVSPSLFIGAMTGGAFGLIASGFFPDLSSSQGLYSILGMGAVAAAVIGAPLSTAVMVFELTGGYALSIALLLTVSIAAGINQAVHGRSFFQSQLEQRGLYVQDGPHRYLVRSTQVVSFMTPLTAEEDTELPANNKLPVLKTNNSLEMALRTFDEGGHAQLPVVDPRDENKLMGWATQVAALRTFNNALVAVSVEEHR